MSRIDVVKEVAALGDLSREELAHRWQCAFHCPPPSGVRRKRDVGSPAAFTRGKLYGMLSNQVYIGKARHRDQVYEGEHAPIIDGETFDSVQKLLKAQAPRRRSSRSVSERHLLTGIIFDETGDRLAPVFTTNHGRRYRYYVSSRIKASGKLDAAGWRVPAHQLEAVAMHAICRILEDRAQLSRWIHELGGNVEDGLKTASKLVERGLGAMQLHEQDAFIKAAFRRLILEKGALRIEVQPRHLVSMLCPVPSCVIESECDNPLLETIEAPFLLKRRGVETRLVIDGPERSQATNPSLVNLIGKAHLFLKMLTDGTTRSLAGVAAITGMHIADVSRALPLAFLAPDISHRILVGRQPGDLTARELLRADEMPVDWSQQRTRLGA